MIAVRSRFLFMAGQTVGIEGTGNQNGRLDLFTSRTRESALIFITLSVLPRTMVVLSVAWPYFPSRAATGRLIISIYRAQFCITFCTSKLPLSAFIILPAQPFASTMLSYSHSDRVVDGCFDSVYLWILSGSHEAAHSADQWWPRGNSWRL